MNPNNLNNRKLNKIHKKIDKLAEGGEKNYFKFTQYINELINNGDYTLFEDVLITEYEIQAQRFQTVDDLKKPAWKEIRLQTKSNVSKGINKIYKSKGVYQQSFDIYKESDNRIIGQIKEIDSFTPDSDYLVKNKLYSQLIRERITALEVTNEAGDTKIIDDVNFDISEKKNLILRYKKAVNFLLS